MIRARMHSEPIEVRLLPQPRHIRLTGGEFSAVSSTRTKIAPTLSRQQGYRIEVNSEGTASFTVHDEPGLFYARQTLAQIERLLERGPLPTLVIEDWPDFPVRGFMLDISRDKV